MNDVSNNTINICELNNKYDLFRLLKVSERKYYYVLYQKLETYSLFDIQKKNGGIRRISAPCRDLLYMQRRIAESLNNFYKFNDKTVHGFVKEKSIKTNAEIHKNSNYILNIDLKNFFDSIHFGRVRGMFMKEPFNLSNYIATNLAKVACYDKKLPQGGATSPIISNIICYRMDRELYHFCRKYNCRYTRYADDITISTSSLSFPKEIAEFNNGNVLLSNTIVALINSEGFIINDEKTRLSSINNRQEVTGLIVNKKVNVKKVYVKELRALLNNTKKYGFYLQGVKYFQKRNILYPNRYMIVKNFQNVLKGKIEFIKMVKGKEDKVYIKYASMFNDLLDKEIFDVDYGLPVKDFAEKRIFPVSSYDELSQGTSFYVEGLGMLTSTHVLMNSDSFFENEMFNKLREVGNFSYNSVLSKTFYLIDHNNRRFFIDSFITKNSIDTDVLFLNCYNMKKGFKINLGYHPEIGETVYLAGYGDFKGFDKTTMNFIEAKITGEDEFMKRKIYCVSEKLYHGMSGGPVLNVNREVIGIVYCGLNIDDTDNGMLSKQNGFILLSNKLLDNIKNSN